MPGFGLNFLQTLVNDGLDREARCCHERAEVPKAAQLPPAIRAVFEMTWGASSNRAVFAGPSQLVHAEWAARGIEDVCRPWRPRSPKFCCSEQVNFILAIWTTVSCHVPNLPVSPHGGSPDERKPCSTEALQKGDVEPADVLLGRG